VKNESDVLTEYTGTGTLLDPYRPLVSENFNIDGYEDVTARVPGSGSKTVVRVSCDGTVLSAIKKDSSHVVFYEQDPEDAEKSLRRKDEVPTRTERTNIKQRLLSLGIPQSVIDKILDSDTREEIARKVKRYLKSEVKSRGKKA